MNIDFIEQNAKEIHRNPQGQYHKEDCPAVILKNGIWMYFCNGSLHNRNGPAITNLGNLNIYIINNQIHRWGGPAISINGHEQYWVNGIQYDENDYYNLSEEKICNNGRNKIIEYKNPWGMLHRSDGPAYIEKNDNGEILCEAYYILGQLHRVDGPAEIKYNLSNKDNKYIYCKWMQNNEIHRENGPAIEHCTGSKEYWIKGKLHRSDGPAITNSNNTIHQWYYNGFRHRDNGPAIENINDSNDNEYYFNNIKYKKDEYQQIINNQNGFPVVVNILQKFMNEYNKPKQDLEQKLEQLNQEISDPQVQEEIGAELCADIAAAKEEMEREAVQQTDDSYKN